MSGPIDTGDTGLRTRIAKRIGTAGTVAALGLLVVIGLAIALALLLRQATQQAHDARRSVVVAEVSEAGFELVSAVQMEGGLAALMSASDLGDRDDFAVQAARTDAALDAYRIALGEAETLLSEGEGVDLPLPELQSLEDVRGAVVDPGNDDVPVLDLYDGFVSQIRESLTAFALFATDATELRLRRAALTLVEAVDVLSRRRDLVTLASAGSSPVDADLRLQLSILDGDRDLALTRAGALLTADRREAVRVLVDSEVAQAADVVVVSLQSGAAVPPNAWFDAATAELDEVMATASQINRDITVLAVERLEGARRNRVLIGVTGGLLLTAAVLAAWAAQVASRERVEALAEHRSLVDGLLRWFGSDAMPDVEGVEVDARYIPAAQLSGAGGDWYDVFRDPAGRIGVVVGDVAGHGADVVARMAETRSIIRAMVHADVGGPARQLERVDEAVESLSLTTVFYGLLDVERGTLTYSRAGHLPGILRRADGTVEYLYHGSDPPVGVAGTGPRSEDAVALRPGDTLVLFTDGLVEDPAHDVLESIEAMATETIVPYEGSLAGLADVLVERRPETAHLDDASILLVRRAADSGFDVQRGFEAGDLEDAGHGV